jgi:hypothetical protein
VWWLHVLPAPGFAVAALGIVAVMPCRKLAA